MHSEIKKTPSVIIGVGIIIRQEGDILMIKRKGSHGEGEWALPGGKIDFGETFQQAALRELEEELGIKGISAKVISLSNQLRYLDQGIHCVIIGMEVEIPPGAIFKIMEPKKIEIFSWFSLDKLPEAIFEGSAQIIRSLKGDGEEIKHIKN